MPRPAGNSFSRFSAKSYRLSKVDTIVSSSPVFVNVPLSGDFCGGYFNE